MYSDVVLSERTKSGGTLRLASDVTRSAVLRDRGHHLGFVIRFFHSDAPYQPVRVIRTASGVRWGEAIRIASELLSTGSPFEDSRQPALPLEEPSNAHFVAPTTPAAPSEIKSGETLIEPMATASPPTGSLSPVNHLTSVTIRRFKRITDASFDLANLNVLVGGNNSGKSSIIQALHFGVALLQSLALSNQWKASTLNPNQLIYSPSEDIYALGSGGRLLQDPSKAMSLDFVLSSGDSCGLDVSKGKNRNISVMIRNPHVAQQLSSLQSPFSIFSPGLAGIAKQENYVSDGVLLRTLARGDANLILRNILRRLSTNEPSWSAFMTDLADIFPNIDITFSYLSSTSEYIDVAVRSGEYSVPLELAGTGVLQALQILSYIHHFSPSIVVLDEPDSHLHPNNQRLLCGLLRRVSEERGTQILLTTHSRHVVDALANAASFLWVRNGTVEVASSDDEIGILLDIGALDVKERAGLPSTTTAVVLTEDELTRSLELVLQSSGFDMQTTAVLPYYGVTGINQLRALVNVIRKTNPHAKIVLHRDRDFLFDDEVEAWKKDVRQLGVEPYVTAGRDIEASFINSSHLSALNPELSAELFDQLIAGVIEQQKDELIKDFVNGRVEVARRMRHAPPNSGVLAVDAMKNVGADPARYAGKQILRAVRAEFRLMHGRNLKTDTRSESLSEPFLAGVAGKIPKPRV